LKKILWRLYSSESWFSLQPVRRVASPYVLQFFPEVLVAGPDATYANLSLSRIKISKAYLKRLIDYVILRISWLNSHCAKRECLGRNC
jgi:hypothetical protein